MMISEFTERTNYTPSFEEYHFIEESYYEFNGDKNEFCKWWKKAQKSGEWAKELKLRETIENMKKQHEKELKEKEENLEFYRPFCQRAYEAEKKAAILELTAAGRTSFEIRTKFGKWEKFENVEVKYISKKYNGLFEFINVIEESGWTRSIQLEEIETILTK